MTIDEIRKLIEVVRETGISELEVEMNEGRVKISNVPPPAANPGIVLPTVLPVSMTGGMPQAIASHGLTVPQQEAAAAAMAKAAEEEKQTVVKSPIVGTYYDAPAPGAPSFVKVGDRVEPKQVLCIIESMKLMNEIEAETAGVVVAKHVENGRPIEYGEALFTLRPE